jgi:hypothetical protein
VIDFYRFEEQFKLGSSGANLEVGKDDDDTDSKHNSTMARMSRRIEKLSLLEPNRLRNVGE